MQLSLLSPCYATIVHARLRLFQFGLSLDIPKLRLTWLQTRCRFHGMNSRIITLRQFHGTKNMEGRVVQFLRLHGFDQLWNLSSLHPAAQKIRQYCKTVLEKWNAKNSAHCLACPCNRLTGLLT